MQRWQDEFSKHPIHATLKILEDNVNSNATPLETGGESERARVNKIIGLMKKTINDLDPDLAPFDVLDALNNQLNSSTINSLRAFAEQGNSARLREANTHINAVLGYVYQLSALRSGRSPRQSDLEAATISFERFAKKIEGAVGDIQSRAAKSINTIDQVATKIDELRNKSEVIESSFKQKIADWENQNSEFISNHKIGFSAIISKSQIEFNELIASVKIEASDAVKSLLESEMAQADSNRTLMISQLDALKQDAEAKHAEILKFYGLVTHDSVTGGHKKIADREHDAAVFWRRFTVGCIIATVGWILSSLFCFTPQLEPEKLFWLQIGKSAALTALLISFSIYASRQSNLHRLNEQKARSFFLKVQAFDPFVASLPDEQRWSMKQAMTERIFGSDETEQDKVSHDAADFKGLDHIVSVFERVKAIFK
jgi:hypothetical protein